MFGSLGSSSRCSRRAFLRNFTQSRFSSGARWLNSGNESHWLELMFLVDPPGLTFSILGTNLGCQHCVARKCQVSKQSLKSQIRWRCCRPLRGLWNLSFSHGIPGHFETTFFEVGNFWGFWSFWAWVSFARSWDPQGRGWCFGVLTPWFYCHFQLGRMTAEWPRGKVQKLSVSYQIMDFPLVIKQSR